MKKIIIDDKSLLDSIDDSEPIFALKDGILEGMVFCSEEGWVLALGGDFYSNGYHESREKCIISNLTYGFTFVDKNMNKIDVENNFDNIYYFCNLEDNIPIFVKKDGKLCGMVIRNNNDYWYIYCSSGNKDYKFYTSLEKCIYDGTEEGYEFYIED